MHSKILVPVVASVVLAGCSVPSYPPPAQQQFPYSDEIEPVIFLAMGMPDTDDQILADVNDKVEGSGWRWTREHPRIKFRLPRTKGWKFRVDFGLPPVNFKDTGPVTVSFVVNGHLLDKVQYTKPGDKRFEKPVPEGWLRANEDFPAGADIDPPWIAPGDQARLGFVLHAMGFVE